MDTWVMTFLGEIVSIGPEQELGSSSAGGVIAEQLRRPGFDLQDLSAVPYSNAGIEGLKKWPCSFYFCFLK